MTKIIELAHNLGMEIACSDEIKALQSAKDAYDRDAELQAKMSEYETYRRLLGEEFSKSTVALIKPRIVKSGAENADS